MLLPNTSNNTRYGPPGETAKWCDPKPKNEQGFKCPLTGGGNLCSCLLLLRVPSPKRKDQLSFAEDPRITRLLSVGRDMVHTWASARIERPVPGTDDPENFLAMYYLQVRYILLSSFSLMLALFLLTLESVMVHLLCFSHGQRTCSFICIVTMFIQESREREIPVFSSKECTRRDKCGYAGDQGVLSRAVVHGLPQRPFSPSDPDNVGVGRFIPNIAMLRCDRCLQSFAEPFVHMTGYGKYPTFKRFTDMLRLAHEVHGLRLFELVTSFASTNGITKHYNPAGRCDRLLDTNTTNSMRLAKWLRMCYKNYGNNTHCKLLEPDEIWESALYFAHQVKDLWSGGSTVRLQLSSSPSAGVDAADW